MRYGCCKNECRGNQLTREGENHHVWHSQHCKLGMAEALISGGRLLQAAIGIDPFGAVTGVICVCECHDRRKRRHGACLSRIDQLTEQHHADQETAQGTTQPVDSAKHIERKWHSVILVVHCKTYPLGSSRLTLPSAVAAFMLYIRPRVCPTFSLWRRSRNAFLPCHLWRGSEVLSQRFSLRTYSRRRFAQCHFGHTKKLCPITPLPRLVKI